MIQILHNPRTDSYLKIKEKILAYDFPWYWNEKSTGKIELDGHHNISFYSHTFLKRPDNGDSFKISTKCSDLMNSVAESIIEILEYNNIPINYFLRINANCTHAFPEVLNSVPHVDHEFDHKSIIIYLTNSGGCTVVGEKKYDPKEDDVIFFNGNDLHYLQTPKSQRRIIIVATFN